MRMRKCGRKTDGMSNGNEQDKRGLDWQNWGRPRATSRLTFWETWAGTGRATQGASPHRTVVESMNVMDSWIRKIHDRLASAVGPQQIAPGCGLPPSACVGHLVA